MRKFKKVYIEITNVCNLKCDFCPSSSLGRPLKFLKEDDFSHVIKSVRPYTDYIYLHLMGEPLMNPKLGRFLEIGHEHNLKVNLTTNGVLIKKARETLLAAKSLRQLNISLHSFEANEQQLSLEEYVGTIADFIKEANEKTKMICAIRLWNMDSNELKARNELNDDILTLLEQKLGLDFKISEQLMQKKNIKLADRIYINMAEKFQWPDLSKDVISENAFCYGLRDQIGILVDGTVVPCCLDSEGKIPLGNIYETSLEEILNGERARNLYDGFSRRCAVEELCKRCGYAQRFNK
ncbi:MAG: radical SAM/SPASM domain-containing protein [Bacillaceae bacterium]